VRRGVFVFVVLVSLLIRFRLILLSNLQRLNIKGSPTSF